MSCYEVFFSDGLACLPIAVRYIWLCGGRSLHLFFHFFRIVGTVYFKQCYQESINKNVYWLNYLNDKLSKLVNTETKTLNVFQLHYVNVLT